MIEFLQAFCFCLFLLLTFLFIIDFESAYYEGALPGFIIVSAILFFLSPIPYSFREYKVIQSEVVPFDLIEKQNKLLVLVGKESIYKIESYETASKLLNNSCAAYSQTWERRYGFNWQLNRVRFFDSAGNLVFDVSK